MPLRLDAPVESVVTDLERYIPARMHEAHVPGLSIALVREAKIVWARGFGEKSVYRHEPVTPETVFEAASLGKPITAYAALKLRDAGLLQLDAPMDSYLSQPYLGDSSYAREVTIRRVLSHTSGLSNNLFWKNTTIHFQPGTKFSYSGVGFAYLQIVIESVTGKSFEDFMQENVLEPLGMASSSYSPPQGIRARMADGYFPVLGLQLPLPALHHYSRPNAASTLVSTPSDLARFMIELMEPRQMSAKATAEMLTQQVTVSDCVAWGLGIGLQHGPAGRAFWHWGSNPGYKSFMLGYPDHKAGVVIMTNGSDGLDIVDDIAQRALGGPACGYWRDVTFISR